MAILRKTKAGNTTKEVLARQAAQAVKSQPIVSVAAAPESTALVIPTIKTSAMSVNLGPMIASAIAKSTDADVELSAAKKLQEERDYTLAAAVTEAFVKMTRADGTVDFITLLGKDNAAKQQCRAKMYIGLGLKKPVMRGKEGAQIATLEWNPDNGVGAILGATDKDDAKVKARKADYVRNLGKTLDKCAKGALWIIETKGVNFQHDKDSGTLMLSGPAIQSTYGAPVVLLNQAVKQPLRDAEGKDQGSTVNLKAKPSFTDIARRAAEAHGKVIMTRADSRPKQFDDPHAAVVHMCDQLKKVLEKYDDEPNDAARAALESVLSAIEEVLG